MHVVDVDTRNRIVRFDGRLDHEVLEFKGVRYTVIFYKNYDRRILQEAPILMKPDVVYKECLKPEIGLLQVSSHSTWTPLFSSSLMGPETWQHGEP